jgi:predicted nucleic acid-binding protein
MRILIDTDVLLDVALARSPHVSNSADVLRWAETGGAACIAWHSIANCAYLLKDDGRGFLSKLLTFVEVAESGKADALRAIHLPMPDLEDALQAACAQAWGADHIITRNLRDYRNAPIPALSPAQFIQAAVNEI